MSRFVGWWAIATAILYIHFYYGWRLGFGLALFGFGLDVLTQTRDVR